MRLSLVLTHACDLACTYCYAGPKDGRRMPLAVGRRAIDRAVRAVPPGGRLDLGLFGGEPLLAWDVGRELVRHARAAARERGVGLAVALTTNGTHVDEAVCDELLALGVRVSVSCDGLPEVHDAGRPRRGGLGSAAAALAAIDRLAARGAPFRVVSVVRPETLDRLVAGARFLADRGAPALVHSLDASAAWRPADARRLAAAVRELRDLWVARFERLEVAWLETKALLLADPSLDRPRCGAGRGEVAVAPSGRLYPCERLVGDDAPGPFASGHVDDGDGPLRVARPLAAAPGPESGCDPCAANGLCANDCACDHLARTGRVGAPDGLTCALEQALIREARAGLAALAAAGRRPAAPRRPRPRRLPCLEVARAC